MQRDPVPAQPESGLIARRTLLGAASVGATALLAGCGGGTGADGGGAAASPTTPAPTSTPGSGGTSPSASGTVLVSLADVPVDGAVSAQTDSGEPILVTQPSAGDVKAFSAICTHKGCTVAPKGNQLVCPCHGSVYDLSTGEVLAGPAPAPLATVDVKVKSGNVVTT
jgi:cytochrome b6-f complex iron-sulfur subunit